MWSSAAARWGSELRFNVPAFSYALERMQEADKALQEAGGYLAALSSALKRYKVGGQREKRWAGAQPPVTHGSS